ncbi:hypothetical protein BJI47_20400 [Rhodococcus sp. 1168]|nr:hypothetical protein BJI47_20400 [Rhodococcus sp. 1168]
MQGAIMTEPSKEDTKKKFREALEKKNHKSATAVEHKDGGPKVNNAHGPADHQRMFRRKSV